MAVIQMFAVMKMKSIAFIIMVLVAGHCLSQTPSEEKSIIETMLDSKAMEYSHPIILSQLDTTLVEYQLTSLINSSTNTFYSARPNEERDSISLTGQEKQRLVEELRAQYDQKWENNDIQDYAVIASQSMNQYLREKYTNTVAMVSKPVLIREGKIGMVFLAIFCCGGSGGFVELFLYKKELGVWKSWIPISQGDF
jgi:hypothetical protein